MPPPFLIMDTYAGEPKESAEDSAETEDQTGTDEPTALLPKSLFGDKDLKPGRACKVKVMRVYDDEVEVAYVPHDGESDEHGDGESMRSAMGKMDEMVSSNEAG